MKSVSSTTRVSPENLSFLGKRLGSGAAAQAKLKELREMLAERFPEARRAEGEVLASGIAAVDEALGGGFPKGAVSEAVMSVPSSGGQLLLASLLRASRTEPRYLALVDGCDGFDPQTMDPELLPYLLWVRCTKAAQALQATDLLVRDGNIALVVLDLRGNDPTELRRQPATVWFRLQRAVKKSGGFLLVLSERAQTASAAVRLVFTKSLPLEKLATAEETLKMEIPDFRLEKGAERETG